MVDGARTHDGTVRGEQPVRTDGGDQPRVRTDGGEPDVRVRQAREDDHEAVVAFTEDTWPDRAAGDYIPRVFPEWVATDGTDQRTLVAERRGDATVVGICQGVLLSAHEAWAQGMRVHPDAQGTGVAQRLNDVLFRWAVDRGATVCRNMVFSWNVQGLGAARGVGFEPGIEFRWMHPEPVIDPSVVASIEAVGMEVVAHPDAAWTFWQRSDARDALGGLALALEESWAVAELTRERLHRAADGDGTRLLTLRDDDGVRAVAYRVRDYEREADDGRRWAEYGLGAWDDPEAARALVAAIRQDADDLGADETRVLIPETPRHVSDAAALGVELGEHPDFVMEAPLTGRSAR